MGYYEAVVDSIVDRSQEDEVRLHIRIEEGRLTRISRATVMGAPEAEGALAALEGRPLARTVVQNAVSKVINQLRDAGYAFAKGEVETDFSDRGAEVILDLEPGVVCTLASVQIMGNEDVSQRTILRGLTFQPRDPFRGRDLQDSRRQLYRSGVFRSVALAVADSVFTSSQIGIQVRVSERPFRSVRLGGGFDTDEDLWASAAWMHRNFGGGARQLRLSGRISGQNREAVVGLRESYFFSSRNWLNVSGFLQRERQATFEQDELGGNIAFERNVAEGADLVFHASAGVVDFSADSAFTEVGVRVLVDTRDDIFDPQRGILAQVNLRERGQLLKANEEFLQATAEARWFVRIPFQSILAFRVQGGLIFELGKVGGVRPVERFFAGGLNSLRGWGLDEVGPRDANGDPLGGLSRVEVSAEVRTRIFPFVGTALFVDVGNVHSQLEAFNPKDLKWSVGVGLRYLSPIGPVRYDVGIRLSTDRPSVGKVQHHISLGQAF